MIADAPTIQEQLQEIEVAAVALAWGAGRILADQFGRQLSIEYKDKNQRDPVTSADKSTQEFLVKEITRLFPSHGILGEEGSDETDPAGALLEKSPSRAAGKDPVPACDARIVHRVRGHAQANSFRTTLPPTSVSRKSRPWCR